ncbi:MAG: phosphate signaling complex protein PhoU [Promethearchaeota archaeon]
MEKFHTELDNLKKDVLDLGNYAINMLKDVMEALIKIDTTSANEIHSRKEKLREFGDNIEDKALKLIALYQPMASDLRTIACILKMDTNLIRIGRYAKDIANIIIKELAGKTHMKKIISLPYMNDIVIKMIEDSLTAFINNETCLIEDLAERDDEVDELRISIFRECLTYMLEDPRNIPLSTAYIMIARYLERCGDHACEMAEKIYYMVTGDRKEIK